MEKVTLSEKAERTIVLSQLTEKSDMFIDFADIALLTGYEKSYIQKTISKKPDFPKPIDDSNRAKNAKVLFHSGSIIRWIRRNTPRFH